MLGKTVKIFGVAIENINCGDIIWMEPSKGHTRRATAEDMKEFHESLNNDLQNKFGYTAEPRTESPAPQRIPDETI